MDLFHGEVQMMQSNEKKYTVMVQTHHFYSNIKCNAKEVLKINPKLVIYSGNDKLYELENIQSLYLFPLTVIDYISNLADKKMIHLSILDIDCNLDYEDLFGNVVFSNLKAVEILIKEDYSENEVLKINQLIKYFYKKGIMVSLNIKNLISVSNLLKNQYQYITYFKIFLSNNFSPSLYCEFLKKLSVISSLKSKDSLVHIKTYLSESDALLYEQKIKDFATLNIDIFQVSKELLPIHKKNINVKTEIQNLIRNLEFKYNDYKSLKFLSVKNLKELYYPRFELDDRNSKKCYSCFMKPYMVKNRILPCKVNKIWNNFDDWSVNYLEHEQYKNLIKKCGVTCDDCASIFENDLLHQVEQILESNNDINICLVSED